MKPYKKKKKKCKKIQRWASSWAWRRKIAKRFLKISLGQRRQWCETNNFSPSTIYRWARKLKILHKYTKQEVRKSSFNKINELGVFPKQQEKVHKKYKKRRANGNKVSNHWLIATMRQTCLKDKPPGFNPSRHIFTNKWARGFRKRKGISLQKRTNNKAKSLLEKIHLIQNYHQWLIYSFPNEEPYIKYAVIQEEDNESDSEIESDTIEYDSYSDDSPSDTGSEDSS